MNDCLLYLGWYNALAPLLFIPMVFSERFADLLLCKATEIIAEPYTHGPFSKLFLLWAGAANGAVGALMLLARNSGERVQRDTLSVVLALYVVMWLAMLVGARGPKWGRGVWVTHGLWIGQMGWMTWVLFGTGP